MKPCSNNRKLIAWLAVDALPASQAGELRAHIQDCPGCRRYLDEISSVAKSLSTPELPPDIQASASFHGRIVRALAAEAARSPWQRLAAWFGVANGPRAVLGSQRPPTRKDAQIFSTLPPQSDALRAEDGSRSVPLGRFWAWLIIKHPY